MIAPSPSLIKKDGNGRTDVLSFDFLGSLLDECEEAAGDLQASTMAHRRLATAQMS